MLHPSDEHGAVPPPGSGANTSLWGATLARVLDILIVAVSTAFAVVVVLVVTFRLDSGWRRMVTAAVAAALLAATISSELTFESVGDWWADHPSTGATVIGVLLATLALLVVEAAVQGALARATERRWRPAGKAAAGAILDAAAGNMRDQQLAVWAQSAFVMDPRAKTAVDMRRAVTGFAAAVSGPIIAAATMLTATDALHKIYEHTLQATRAAAEYEAIVQAFAWVHLPQDPAADPHDLSDEGRDLWWDAVTGPWMTLRAEMQAFARHDRTDSAATTS